MSNPTPKPEEIVVGVFVLGMLFVSFWACISLFVWRTSLFRFRPRTLVPWNALAATLALFFVLTAILAAAVEHKSSRAEPAAVAGKSAEEQLSSVQTTDDEATDERSSAELTLEKTADVSFQLAFGMAQEIIIVGGFIAVGIIIFRPTWRDFGLPRGVSEFLQDAALGGLAGVAALGPILLLQLVLQLLMYGKNAKSGHQLMKMLSEGGNSSLVFFLATIMAVVVAPICEEFAFRVLLQGWLEKWECRSIFARRANEQETANADDIELVRLVEIQDEATALFAGFGPSAGTLPTVQVAEATSASDAEIELCEPPSTGITSLPFAWVPICISSLLFALAHFGYGPEPIPLFYLALLLGYLYYRTNRVTPCIFAHATFNSFTMIMLWLSGGNFQ